MGRIAEKFATQEGSRMFDWLKKRRKAKEARDESEDMAIMLKQLDTYLGQVAYLQSVMLTDGPAREQFIRLATPALSGAVQSAVIDRALGFDGNTAQLVLRIASLLYLTADLAAMRASGYKARSADELVWMQFVIQAVEKHERTASLAHLLPRVRDDVRDMLATTRRRAPIGPKTASRNLDARGGILIDAIERRTSTQIVPDQQHGAPIGGRPLPAAPIKSGSSVRADWPPERQTVAEAMVEAKVEMKFSHVDINLAVREPSQCEATPSEQVVLNDLQRRGEAGESRSEGQTSPPESSGDESGGRRTGSVRGSGG